LQRLKGFPEPFHLFEVVWPDTAQAVWPDTARTGSPGRPSVPAGRAREMALLRAGLQDALAGQMRLILISGEPGIGKTFLADAIAAEAGEQGIWVLWGRCWESGGAPAYWPWLQILRALVQAPGSDRLVARTGSAV